MYLTVHGNSGGRAVGGRGFKSNVVQFFECIIFKIALTSDDLTIALT
jgi:hypothetical protein